MKNKIAVFASSIEYRDEAETLAKRLGCEMAESMAEVPEDKLILGFDENGLALMQNDLKVTADFTNMKKRLKPGNLQQEMLIKAIRIKGFDGELKVLDATAGMGEDSLLLAAAGFSVKLYEYNPVIAALLGNTLTRAKEDPELADIVSRMELISGDSIKAMNEIAEGTDKLFEPDVILLDPMFPERQKSALIKKKFQLLQQLEMPCGDETEMLSAAMAVHPKKIVIKRPVKGPYLAGIKPSHSYAGKAIRYDCIILPPK